MRFPLLNGFSRAYVKRMNKINQLSIKTKPPWNVTFFGTDDFSLYTLKILHLELKKGELIDNLEIVTSLKSKNNPVRTYAKNQNLLIHNWPVTVLGKKFDIGIVVSFGHLIPADIINCFTYGILNVHASLLPRWRGAAPIIHAIANGDTETGVTIMRIQPTQFDVGSIVKQQAITIPKNVTMLELYKSLAELGSHMLLDCLQRIPNCLDDATPQPQTGITYAPKVTNRMAHVNWHEMSAQKICLLYRALYGLYPLTTTWNKITVKLYDISLVSTDVDIYNVSQKVLPGLVVYAKKKELLYIQCADGKYVSFKQIGISGKKPMTAKDFNNGYVKKEIVSKRFFT